MIKMGKKCMALLMVVMLLGSTVPASAATKTKTSTDTWKSFGITFVTVQLSAQGDTVSGKIYDVWFSKVSSVYPFYISDKSTWSYQIGNYGYAKGQYTLHGSIGYKITGDIRTEVETITIVY